MALLVAGFLLGMGGLIYMTGRVEPLQQEAVDTRAQLDDVAQDLQEDATTIAALCATGSEVARALDTAGQCGRAAERLANPVVAAQRATLSPDQINAIVARVLALTPPPTPVDAVVESVLGRIASDPALRGLGETEVRAIVATAVAALPPPVPGPPGTPGAPGVPGQAGLPGVSFAGLDFARRDGECVAVVSLIDPDGSVRTETTEVGSAACEDAPPPAPSPSPDPPDDPPPSPDPDPDPTDEPDPDPTDEPDPDPEPTGDPDPTIDSEPDPQPDVDPGPDPQEDEGGEPQGDGELLGG